MALRRPTMLALGAAALGACTLGGGAALGAGVLRAGAHKPLKCKANVCVHWNSDASYYVNQSAGVDHVAHPATGIYCVELVGKLLAAPYANVQLTIDYNNGTPGQANIAVFTPSSTPCGTNGLMVNTFNGDDGSWDPTDMAVMLTVP